MSNKIFLICLALTLSAMQLLTAQTDPAAVKDSTTVQTTTPTTPVSGVTIPEGTKLMVNVNTPINTHDNPAGSTIKSILEVDLIFDGKVISPKGSPFTEK